MVKLDPLHQESVENMKIKKDLDQWNRYKTIKSLAKAIGIENYKRKYKFKKPIDLKIGRKVYLRLRNGIVFDRFPAENYQQHVLKQQWLLKAYKFLNQRRKK